MSYDNNFSHDHDEFGEIICSKAVRAGKRTYFLMLRLRRATTIIS